MFIYLFISTGLSFLLLEKKNLYEINGKRRNVMMEKVCIFTTFYICKIFKIQFFKPRPVHHLIDLYGFYSYKGIKPQEINRILSSIQQKLSNVLNTFVCFHFSMENLFQKGFSKSNDMLYYLYYCTTMSAVYFCRLHSMFLRANE